MKTSKNVIAALFIGGLGLAGCLPVAVAGTVHVGDPELKLSKLAEVRASDGGEIQLLPGETHLLNFAGLETVDFVQGAFFASKAFEINQAGTYRLTLTDMAFPDPLRELGATVTTVDDKLTELFGTGEMLFDMTSGTHYLSYFAKMQDAGELGLFELSLRLQDRNPSAVPVPATLWLFGSGLIGIVGALRRTF